MEINSGSSTLPIPDDTRLLGQRPSNQGGAPVPFSVSELTDKIMGGGGQTLVREGLTATKSLRAVPVTDGASEFVGVHPYVEGSPTFAHTVDLYAGIVGRFGKDADHGHYKIRVPNVAGPGPGTAGERAQFMYSARAAGDSTINIHGYASEIPTTTLGNEHSIDTTATSVGGSPSFLGTIKLRHTSNAGLSLNQRVLFRVFSAVAGIQASFFYGLVTQIPTLVSGVYETLVQLTGLDGNHWDASKAANTAAQNADWALMTLTSGEINAANKISLARDTGGPTDQLLVTWATAHNLAAGQNVVVWADGAISGLSGIWAGFHSGFVVEVISSTQVKVRIRNMRSLSLRSFSGSVASATSTWAVFAGTLDPHHEVIPTTNAITVQRDATGRTRRVAVGCADVTADDEWAIGTLDAASELRGSKTDVRIGGQSLRTMTGSRAPRGGIRCIRDGTTNTATITTGALGGLGTLIGTGEFSIGVQVDVDLGNGGLFVLSDSASFWGIRLPANGELNVETWDGTTVTVTGTGIPSYILALNGTIATISLIRTSLDLQLWCNGIKLWAGSPASWNRPVTGAAILRAGGLYIATNRHHGIIYNSFACPFALSPPDIAAFAARGRLPQSLQNGGATFAYQSDFSAVSAPASYDAWVGNGVGLEGNIGSIGGRDACLRATVDSATAAHLLYRLGAGRRGGRIRVSYDAYRPSSNTLVTGVVNQHYNQFATAQSFQIPSDTWTTVTQDVEDYGNSGNNTGISLNLCNVNGQTTFTGNGSDVLYIRNVKVLQLGAAIDLDCDVGAGFQVPDKSGNGYHAILTAPFAHVVPKRNFQITQWVNQSGNTTLPGIPTNARITSVTANAAGTVVLSIGNTGFGTQIVNAQSLGAGVQDVTLAGRFSTTGNLVANLSNAVAVHLTLDCVMTGS